MELYRAADYLSEELLGEGPVERPVSGPSALVPTNNNGDHHIPIMQTTFQPISNQPIQEATNDHVNQRLPQQTWSTEPTVLVEFNTPLPHLTYNELEHLTDNFDLNPISQNGRKLGAGAFGTVFLGEITGDPKLDIQGTQTYQKLKLSVHSKVAVKRLHSQKVRSQ